MNDKIYSLEPLWGKWKVEKFLGRGSIGSVYKVYKRNLGNTLYSAVKIITVPTDSQLHYIKSFLKLNTEKKINAYVDNCVAKIIKEIKILNKHKGNNYVVDYEDHLIEKMKHQHGWIILIRMELLKTLNYYLKSRNITLEDVIKIGIDVLTGLHSCHNLGIIHRDIKEDNIFVSDTNDFKIGDFSAARELESGSYAQTRIGTLLYMPPEVFFGKPYNKSADLYSLGIVLYKILNYNRMPFMPSYPESLKISDQNNAQMQRFNCTPIPEPYFGDSKLKKVVLKACDPYSHNRYQTAFEMRQDLESLINSSLKYRNTTIYKNKKDNTSLLKKLFNFET